MDEGDISAEREEIERQSARLTCKKAEGPKPTGSCLYCEVPVESTVRWCCASCRDEWDGLAKRRR